MIIYILSPNPIIRRNIRCQRAELSAVPCRGHLHAHSTPHRKSCRRRWARFEDMTDAVTIARWPNANPANIASIHRGTDAGIQRP